MPFTLRVRSYIVLLLFVSMTFVNMEPTNVQAITKVSRISATHQTSSSTDQPVSKSSLFSINYPVIYRSSPIPPITPSGVIGKGNLIYGKGLVQLQPTVYLIFWGPNWTTSAGKTTKTVVTSYFNDVSSTSFEDILTQYYMKSGGSQLYIPNTVQFVNDNTHVLVDTSKPSVDPHKTCGNLTILDSTIQQKIQSVIDNQNWPKNNDTTYFIYTASGGYTILDPQGHCSTNAQYSFCGYHNIISTYAPYAEIPFPDETYPKGKTCLVPNPPNDKYGDALASVSSHEQFEAITDPETTGGWRDSEGFEIGDKCNDGFFPPSYTKLNNGGTFQLQEEYSNATSSCVNASASYKQTVYVGASDQYMYALNAATGKRKWRYATGNTPSTAVDVNGILYFGSDAVYALNANNGKLIWRYAATGNTVYTPAVANGVVYAGANDGYLYALNANTGVLLWRYQAAGSNENVYAPLVDNGAVYFTSGGYTFALNASTGAPIWQVTYYAESNGIAVGNNKVYLTENNYVYALNESDGSLAWQSAQEESYLNIPVVANGVVYVSGSSGELYALNADTGAFLWIFNSGLIGYYSVPAVVNGMIYIGFGNDVEALTASDGTLQWTYSTGNHIESMPAVDQSIVNFGSDDSYVYSLNANDGLLIWQYQTSIGASGVVGSPIIAPYM